MNSDNLNRCFVITDWLVSLLIALSMLAFVVQADMMRKSIVFDIKTPKVFYCPQHKPKNMEKLIVRAVPLDKLCEFDGEKIPKDSESDCYNDIDETDYACAEKQRIMVGVETFSFGQHIDENANHDN